MRKILVQLNNSYEKWATHFSDNERFRFVQASDDEIPTVLKDNFKSINGIICFTLSANIIKISELVRNERLFDSLMPIAFVGKQNLSTEMPFGTKRFAELSNDVFDFIEKPLKPRILVVEDDEGIRDVIKLNLEGQYEVKTAADGLSGLNEARTGQYDCILLDVRLPNMSGKEIVEELIRIESTTPIIIMTAYDSGESEVDFKMNGAFEYLRKPFKDDEVIRDAIMKSLINKHRSDSLIELEFLNKKHMDKRTEYEEQMGRYT